MQGRFAILLLLVALYVASAENLVEELECPEKEEWNLCGELCEPNCLVKKPNPEFCPTIECTKFTASCRCKDGYVRDIEGTGLCIEPQHCKISTPPLLCQIPAQV